MAHIEVMRYKTLLCEHVELDEIAEVKEIMLGAAPSFQPCGVIVYKDGTELRTNKTKAEIESAIELTKHRDFNREENSPVQQKKKRPKRPPYRSEDQKLRD